MEEISQNEEILVVEPTSKWDIANFEGQRVKIESLETKKVKNLFPDGKTYNPESTEMKWIVEIKTAPVRDVKIDDDGNLTILNEPVKFTQEDGSEKLLQITHRFNLQMNEAGKPEISKHAKAAFWAFVRKMGCDGKNLNEIRTQLIGRLVTITTVPSKNPEEPDRKYLDIVCK